ncbi:MAG: SpoIVB peptidase S55 domain-containing protein [Hominisplanchenecus sp.]
MLYRLPGIVQGMSGSPIIQEGRRRKVYASISKNFGTGLWPNCRRDEPCSGKARIPARYTGRLQRDAESVIATLE